MDDRSCEAYQRDVSARLDGEATEAEPRLLERHLRSCPTCAAFAEQTAALPVGSPVGSAAVRSAGAITTGPPSMAASHDRGVDRLVRRVAAADRDGQPLWLRAALLVVAIEVIVLSLPDFVAHGEGAHDARHLASFSLAYGIALILPVLRPARARTALPVAVVLAGALVATATVDVVQGHIPLVSEATHIAELLSVLFLWLLARRQARPGPA